MRRRYRTCLESGRGVEELGEVEGVAVGGEQAEWVAERIGAAMVFVNKELIRTIP